MAVPNLSLGRVQQTFSSSTTPGPTRGLANRGQNNCFLNVVVQALVRVPEFQTKLEEVVGEHECAHKEEDCVLCCLNQLIQQQMREDKQEADAGVLKKSLASRLALPSFEVDGMNDAGEVYEGLLGHLHDLTHPKPGLAAECRSEGCWVHKALALGIEKTQQCKSCLHRNAKPEFYWNYVRYNPASDIYRSGWRDVEENRLFRIFTSKAEDSTCDNPDCPAKHYSPQPKTVQTLEKAVHVPVILAVGLVWSTAPATLSNISNICDVLTEKARLDDLPFWESGKAWGDLVGIICYYMQSHYVAYFKQPSGSAWTFTDDSTVSTIESFKLLRMHIKKSRYQPCILFYRTGAAAPVEHEASVMGTTEVQRATRAAAHVEYVAPVMGTTEVQRATRAAAPVETVAPVMSTTGVQRATQEPTLEDEEISNLMLEHAIRMTTPRTSALPSQRSSLPFSSRPSELSSPRPGGLSTQRPSELSSPRLGRLSSQRPSTLSSSMPSPLGTQPSTSLNSTSRHQTNYLDYGRSTYNTSTHYTPVYNTSSHTGKYSSQLHRLPSTSTYRTGLT